MDHAEECSPWKHSKGKQFYKVFTYDNIVISFVVILMRPEGSLQVVCTCWHCLCLGHRPGVWVQIQHKQVVVVVWLGDRATTQQPPSEQIGAPHEQSALPRDSALPKKSCLCLFSRSCRAFKSAVVVFSMFLRKGTDDDCSIVWGVYVCA